jgi:hypothetical protein
MPKLKHNGQKVGRFPVVVMKMADFLQLPAFASVSQGLILQMPIGTQFRFTGCSEGRPPVIGEVVKFGDVLCEQWGSSVLFQPDRWVNRYSVIFEPEEAVNEVKS